MYKLHIAVFVLIILTIVVAFASQDTNFTSAQVTTNPDRNIAVAIIIDDSGSNAAGGADGSGSDPNFIRGTAAKQLIDLLESGDEVTVITFADDVGIQQAVFTFAEGDTAKEIDLKSTFKRNIVLRSSGSTNMCPAVRMAKEALLKSGKTIKFAILLTDGGISVPAGNGCTESGSIADEEEELIN